MKVDLPRGKQLDEFTVAEKTDLIKTAVETLFFEKSAILYEEMLLNKQNADSVMKNRDKALAKYRTAKPPTVEVAAGEEVTHLTVTGDHGKVTCEIGRSPIIYYDKADGKSCIPGSAVFSDFDAWASLSRWCSMGSTTFNDEYGHDADAA